jgi:thymidylate synthase ThyX
MISAKIITDSVCSSVDGKRITSFILEYPRFIHAELMTHRVFSRNAASSRAIPINKFIEDVLTNPAMPIHWGAKQKGMQADSEVDEETKIKAMQIWHEAKEDSIRHAKRLNELGLHKQVANRLMEPFFHITTLVTATEFKNFFKLRAHKAAQPEIRELAYKMLDLYENNIPKEKNIGEWHIPFGDQYLTGLSIREKLKVATARAARISYKNFEGQINIDNDYQLHNDLLAEGHFSPFEHSAVCEIGIHDNFDCWRSYRNIVKNNLTNEQWKKLEESV